MARNRFCNISRGLFRSVDAQALEKWDCRVEIVSPEQVAQHLLGADFSHPLPLTRLDTPSQFFSIAIKPNKVHLPFMRSYPLNDLLYKPVVLLAFAVDKGENRVDSLLRGFLYHLQPILAGETPEGLCSKLENRLDKLDRDMIVEKLDPCQLCQFSCDCQLARCWGSIDEDESHRKTLLLG